MKNNVLWAMSFTEALGITGIVSWLFYDSYFGFFLLLPCMIFVVRMNRNLVRQSKKKFYQKEFREVLLQIGGCLNAGYSVESAFYQIQINQRDRETYKEIQRICRGLDSHQALENLIADWGKRWDIQEICEFANMIKLTKQFGGNMPQLIRVMCRNMTECSLVDEEIQTMIASKRLEGNIMIGIPFFILLYMRCVNGGYLQPLYEAVAGKLLMSTCLLMWGVSIGIIEKIIRIEV